MPILLAVPLPVLISGGCVDRASARQCAHLYTCLAIGHDWCVDAFCGLIAYVMPSVTPALGQH
jgi:hypothetical protein